jgi:hypothetical protein
MFNRCDALCKHETGVLGLLAFCVVGHVPALHIPACCWAFKPELKPLDDNFFAATTVASMTGCFECVDLHVSSYHMHILFAWCKALEAFIVGGSG